MLNVGLVGFGAWGRHILRDLRSLGAAVHVADIDPAARHAALQAGASGIAERADDLPELDGYIVATLTTSHAAVAESLLPRRRPIFIEKPLTADVAAARRLAERGEGMIFLLDKWRYHPAIQCLRDSVRSGALGDVLAIRTFRLGRGSPHRDVDTSWILLPHDLGIGLEIMGMLPPAVAAFCPVPDRTAHSLIAVLRRDNPAFQLTSEVSITYPVNRRVVSVIGSRACARFDDADPEHIEFVDGFPGNWAAESRRQKVGPAMPLMEELKAFIDYLCGGAPPLVPVRDGLLVVERIAQLRMLAGIAG